MVKVATQVNPGVSFGRAQLIVPSGASPVHVPLGLIVVLNSVAAVDVVAPLPRTSTTVAFSVGCVSDRLVSVLLTVTVYFM